MLNKKVLEILESRTFISVATCDSGGRPNAASKFLLKVEGDFLYLIDYTIGRTFTNLKSNPRLSLSFFDTVSLVGYQINGRVEVIESGAEFKKISQELLEKQVTKGKGHASFELGMADTFAVFKVKIEDLVEMRPSGMLRREKV
jgi:general stress protein 26